jgi:hypothetical protein
MFWKFSELIMELVTSGQGRSKTKLLDSGQRRAATGRRKEGNGGLN